MRAGVGVRAACVRRVRRAVRRARRMRDGVETWASTRGRDARASRDVVAANARDVGAESGVIEDDTPPSRARTTEATTARALVEEPRSSLTHAMASLEAAVNFEDASEAAKKLKERLRSRRRRAEQSEAARERERLRSQKRRDLLTLEQKLEISKKRALARLEKKAAQSEEVVAQTDVKCTHARTSA